MRQSIVCGAFAIVLAAAAGGDAPAKPAAARGASAQALYTEGVAERRGGHPDKAAALLRRAAKLEPKNADIALQLGLALMALKRLADAEAELRRALLLAPDYVDVEIALARIELWTGRRLEGEMRVRRLARLHPERTDVGELARTLDAPKPADPKPAETGLRLTRFDGSVGYAHLSGGRPPWREAALGASFAWPQGEALSALIEHASRFDQVDTYLEVRFDTRLSPSVTGYILGGATPDAAFKPEVALAFGGAAVVLGAGGPLQSLSLTADAKIATFATGDVESLLLGVDAEFFAGRVLLTARQINLIDENDDYQNGFMARLLVQPDEAVGVFGGYAKAPDTSEGRTFETRTSFAGVRVAFGERIIATATYAHDELQGLYDRDSGNLAVSYRFAPL